ncbi:MAG: hypothetical protein ABS913_10350 [Desemzia incerta]
MNEVMEVNGFLENMIFIALKTDNKTGGKKLLWLHLTKKEVYS